MIIIRYYNKKFEWLCFHHAIMVTSSLYEDESLRHNQSDPIESEIVASENWISICDLCDPDATPT